MKFPLSETVGRWCREHTYKPNGWEFSSQRKNAYIFEYDEWSEYYLPISIKNMIVLDVGAGEGETARFFLEHGAKSVICIEKNINCAKWLRKNAECHPISYFIKPFELNDLNMNFDFLKMDIEGYEEMLLDKHVVIQKPCVVEVHGLQLWDRFQELGYVVKNKHIDYGAECFVYRCLDKAKVIK